MRLPCSSALLEFRETGFIELGGNKVYVMNPSKAVLRNLFFAATGLLAGTLLFTYLVAIYVARANRAMASERAAIGSVNLVLSTLKDAETGQRGYLLTGKEEYLTPYKRALKDLGRGGKMLND